MRLPTPRVIAIDDDLKHLEGLAQGLNQYGTACLPVHYEGDDAAVSPCPQVRVIFADLHLSDLTSGDHRQDFGVIGGLIQERIKPSGPYFIVLWTMYPDQATRLQNFLDERLENVAKPFKVQALDKNNFLDLQPDDVKVKDLEALVKAIERSVEGYPQFGALLNWEERVLDGAAGTLSSITKMAESCGEEVGKLLWILAEGAVGKDHIEDDRFRAVNDALLPILADRLASMRSQNSDNQLWKDALREEGKVSIEKAARLNSFLHIAPSAHNGNERGAVIALPEEFLDNPSPETFDSYSKDMKDMFEKQFSSKPFHVSNSSHWVLVQTQASCDYAQNQPGLLPFHLGLLMPKSSVSKNKKPPAALWCSPCFEYDQQVQYLHVSARFPVSLLRERAIEMSPLFRLREQLLNNLIYHLHGYGARPGFISFRGSQ